LKRLLLVFSALGALILAFILLPLLNTLVSALLDWQLLVETAKKSAFWQIFGLTAYAALIATMIAAALGTPLAYVLARKDFFGKEFVRGVIDVPVIIPHMAAGIALLSMLSRQGVAGVFGLQLTETLFAVVAAMLFVSVPFYVDVAFEGFRSVDARFENVARSLGASSFEAFVKVTLPLAARHLLAGAVLCWARAVSEFAAIIAVAYYPMVISTYIWEVFLSEGYRAARSAVALVLVIALLIFAALRALMKPMPE